MNRILGILQIPPPLHGVSVMNSYVLNSKSIKDYATVEIIDLKFAKSNRQLKKFTFLKVFLGIKYGIEIIRKIKNFHPEIVYFTLTPSGIAFYRDALYVLIIKLFKTKLILHLHGKGVKRNSNNILKKRLYKWVFYKTHVICLSKTLSKDINDIYCGTPFIVQNGIYEHCFKKLPKNQRNQQITQILFLSNYIKNKGIIVLIEALNILKNSGYHFNAKLVGAPADVTIKMLNDLIFVKGLRDYVEILGPLYDTDKYNEFMIADIFVFPTYNDAFPLVILEAMQFALPVISTFEGSIPDIIINNETGYLVEKNNTQMLAEKIALIIDDPASGILMGKRGYDRFVENYTLSHFEDSLNDTFKAILSTN